MYYAARTEMGALDPIGASVEAVGSVATGVTSYLTAKKAANAAKTQARDVLIGQRRAEEFTTASTQARSKEMLFYAVSGAIVLAGGIALLMVLKRKKA